MKIGLDWRIVTPEQVQKQAEMLANRVRKTHRQIQPRFERRGIGAFRLYDRDIPEIRVVMDWYEGHLVCAEYTRTQTQTVPDYLGTLARAVATALEVPQERLHLKERRTRPVTGQRYERLARSGERLEVREGKLRFLVNLDDYVDTGLFLDHRETRAQVGAEAAGRTFLNVYGYTGSFTCYAAAGGATSTTTVDASGNYLDWARANLSLNGLPEAHNELIRAEVRSFLADTRRRGKRFDLVVVDPPSFSDRGPSHAGFDVQEDHVALLEEILAVTAPGGIVYFSTNHQRFEPHLDRLRVTACDDITEKTLPEDFRNRTVHRAWRLVAPG